MNSNEKKKFNPERVLMVVRGCPGSGKSTFAEMLARKEDKILAADMFFEDNSGNYEYVANKLKYAHEWCFETTEKYLKAGISRIFVTNVFDRTKDVDAYKELAERYGYSFVSLVLENRNGQSSIHDVPQDNVQRMANRFSIKLN